jgi:tyrosine-protein phosphatase YwqE
MIDIHCHIVPRVDDGAAHDHKYRRPLLSAARNLVAKRFGHPAAEALVEDNPRAIVAGEQVPFFSEPIMKN